MQNSIQGNAKTKSSARTTVIKNRNKASIAIPICKANCFFNISGRSIYNFFRSITSQHNNSSLIQKFQNCRNHLISANCLFHLIFENVIENIVLRIYCFYERLSVFLIEQRRNRFNFAFCQEYQFSSRKPYPGFCKPFKHCLFSFR